MELTFIIIITTYLTSLKDIQIFLSSIYLFDYDNSIS